MLKVLVAVDGSPSSNRAVDHVIKLKEAEGKMALHIINVQIPIESGHARMFVSGDDLEGYYREGGDGRAQERAR